ncbi:MAG TPA: CBS domain-containing protein [Acidimicrobiales bacterium]|jgi:CBS domain-containing protein
MTTCDAPVGSLQWAEPISVGDEMTLRAVATLLNRYAIGAAVVRHGDDPGMVSERDIVGALAAGGDPDELWSADVMTPRLVTVSPDTSVIESGQRMLEAGVRHLAIVDGDEIVGVLSMRDLFALLVEALE